MRIQHNKRKVRNRLIAVSIFLLLCIVSNAENIIDPNPDIRIQWEKPGSLLSVKVANQPPGKPMILIQALSTVEKPRYTITHVALAGDDVKLHWIHNSDGLKVTVPLNTLREKTITLLVTVERKPNFLPKDYSYDDNQMYIEDVAVPEYEWASEDAYEAFNDLKYGIRIHWGLYSKMGVEASWPYLKMSNEKRMEYTDSYKTFNPKSFDADKWMTFFKDNGMKMFAFTSRHHDGFSLFDTKTVVKNHINWTSVGGPKVEPYGHPFDIMETPFNRDIVKELCESAHKFGIKIDLYYSNIDWFDADQRGVPVTGLKLGNLTAADDGELKRAMQRHRDQLKELLTNYGNIDMVCLDESFKSRAWPEMRQTMLELRKIQPNTMFRNRSIHTYGDYYTPEGMVPGNVEITNMPWFVIYPLCGIFAYDPNGDNYRDGTWIVDNVIDATSKGGNFMVSIGPDGDGLFHPKAIKAVETAGKWFQTNGEAIFATRPWKIFGEGPSATAALASSSERKVISYGCEDIRFTRSKDHKTIYAILMGIPGSKAKISIKSLSSESEPALTIKKITSLETAEELNWTRDESGLKIVMPEKAKGKIAFCLKISLN